MLDEEKMQMYYNIYHTGTVNEKKCLDVLTQEIVGERLGIKNEIFTKSITHYSSDEKQ